MSPPRVIILFVIMIPDMGPAGGVLRLGDEPAALARGRLLTEIEAARGREPEVIFPAKGEVRARTTFDGEDAEWLLRSAAGSAPVERDWLLALAAAAEDAGPFPHSAGISAQASQGADPSLKT